MNRPAEVTTVLVVSSDGHDVVADLAGHRRYRPAGRVGTLAEAAEVVRSSPPDVVLVVVDRLEDLAAFVDHAREVAGPCLVVVSGLPAEVGLLACMAAGAGAYVAKPVPPGLLAAAVDAVVRGQTLVDPRSTEWLVRFALHGYRTEPHDGLTMRQAQVLQLVRGGLTNRQIAQALGLSAETVKSHLQEAMRRLGVHDRWRATDSLERRRNGGGGPVAAPSWGTARPS